MERVIAYVDGFNLYFGLKSKGWRRYYWLDIPQLAEHLLRPSQRLNETKYFTSRVSASATDPEKPKRQNVYLEAIAARSNLSIFFGHYLRQSVTCGRCGATWQKFAEKMTDVNIATELLADAFLDRYDTAIIITGDSDLIAPIQAVRRIFPGKRMIVAFPPARRSVELERVASSSLHIGRAKIADSQMPEEVVKPDGYILKRPLNWK